MSITVTGDATVSGDLRLTGNITPTKTRANLLSTAQVQPFVIPWTYWRVWNALGTNLPGTAATDDLGLIGGTWTSASPCLQTKDQKALGSATSAYARAQIPLPWEYQSAQTVTLRFHAGMVTTIASDTAKLDVVCYETDEEVGLVGSPTDICATAAQSINSTVFADIDFTITPTNLAAGDLLDVRIDIEIDDTGTGTAVIGCIGAAKLLCDVR